MNGCKIIQLPSNSFCTYIILTLVNERQPLVLYIAYILMRKLLFAFCFLCLSLSGNAQQIPAYTAKDIFDHTASPDTVYIINFWATWCAPCVHELPEFNDLYNYYEGKPVKIILISLDFKEDYPYKLEGFLQRKKLLPAVAWLSDPDPNSFIPKIDNSWQGSIPATLIVAPSGHFKKFIEGTITKKRITKIVDPLLN